MEVFYTLHVKKRMLRKKIEKIWVEEALKHPDYISKDNRAYYAKKRLNGMSIEVVYIIKESYIRVITVYWL